jgi:hypothetical protein
MNQTSERDTNGDLVFTKDFKENKLNDHFPVIAEIS